MFTHLQSVQQGQLIKIQLEIKSITKSWTEMMSSGRLIWVMYKTIFIYLTNRSLTIDPLTSIKKELKLFEF